MRKVILAFGAAALLGLAYGASPAAAVPTGPAQIAAPDSALTQARMTKKQMMMRKKKMMNKKKMRSM